MHVTLLNKSCREVTRLLLEGEDRPLTLAERVAVRFHMWICAACPRFERQVKLMRGALGRWKSYRESDAPPT